MKKDKIKLICLDLNKTLINENTWIDLNLAMGMTKKEDDILFKFYEEGIITYSKWQDIIESIYLKRGKATRKNIGKAIFRYTYKKGAKEIVEYLIDKGYKVALISSSIDRLVERVSKELNINLFSAGNKLIFDGKGYLKQLKCLGEEKDVKLNQLKSFCKRLNIKLENCICIGDGDNDRELFASTKRGITFSGSKLEDIAWKVIDELADIKKIL